MTAGTASRYMPVLYTESMPAVRIWSGRTARGTAAAVCTRFLAAGTRIAAASTAVTE